MLSTLGNSTVRQLLRTFHPMQLVLVWRKHWPSHIYQGKRGAKKSGKPHWIGPGRVVFHEVLPHQHHTDERRHVVWVLLQKQLLRCSVHSARPTTSLEQTQFEINNKEDISRWRSLLDLLPKKEFIDISQEEPGPDEREQPDLPDQPNSSTTYRPTRRLWTKTKPPAPPPPDHVTMDMWMSPNLPTSTSASLGLTSCTTSISMISDGWKMYISTKGDQHALLMRPPTR